MLVACGVLQPGALETAGELDLYSFAGEAGQIVTLALASTGGFSPNPASSGSASIALYATSGALVGGVRSNGLTNLTLPTTGTYALLVSATNLSTRGTYNVSVQCLLPVPMPAPQLQCGANAGAIGAPGDMDLYRTTGGPGRTLTLVLTSTGGFSPNPASTGGASLALFDPTGALVVAIRSNGQTTANVPIGGSYVVRVSATNLSTIGSYAIFVPC